MNMIILAARAHARLLIACAAGLIVALVLVVTLVQRGAAPASHDSTALAPDPASVTYRYAASSTRADQADTIAALEQRLRTTASPMYETAELAELYYQRALLDGDTRDYAASEAMAQRSLALVRKPNGALLTLAKLANARHDFRTAIALAREHMLANPTSAGYLILATAHLALGETAAAAEAAHAAVALTPDGNGYLMRALVMQAQGRDAEAAFDFARAVRVEAHGDPQGAARLRALWGRFLLARGELAGARRVLAESLRVDPAHGLALALEGELALRTGKLAEAEALFDQAFVASRQVRYLIDQARASQLAGDRAGADALRSQVEEIVRAELGEGGLGHRLDLVEVLIDRGGPAQLAEAVMLAREEVAKRGSPLARFQLARALARTGQLEDAMDQVQTVLATGAREAQIYELAARLETLRGNAPRAALYRREADRLDPGRSGWRELVTGAR
ncbi:MAG: hypothetical protein WKG01_27945 [Kofleriaceae bacterium]